MTNSFKRIEKIKNNVIATLTGRGVEERYLRFGGPGEHPARTPTVPTDARSEFLANRAMGDWAEKTLAAALTNQVSGYKVEHYGDNDRIAAGEEGFREFYLGRLERVRVYGKRPDLLLLPEDVDCPKDMPNIPTPDLDGIVQQALAAIEVRSSKFEAETYMREKRKRTQSENISIRDSLNFTVKVEDLIIVYRWMERTQCTQLYAQVFFDSVYAVNFADMFETIASGEGFIIQTPAKSQQKATIMIPVTSGRKIAAFNSLPKFVPERRVTKLGRHDAFVRPVGGRLRIVPDELLAIIGA